MYTELSGVTLRFDDSHFRYYSASNSDTERLGFLFREFVGHGEVAVEFDLAGPGEEPFVANLLTHGRPGGRPRFRTPGAEEWLSWDDDNTPIPPFTVPPLCGRFLVLHGSAARVNGRTFGFCGPSFAGKSSLLLSLAWRGADVVADDALVFPIGTATLLRWPKAVGVRKPTLDLLPWLRAPFADLDVGSKLWLPSQQGRPETTILHLADILGRPTYVTEPRLQLDELLLLDRPFAGVQPGDASTTVTLLHQTCSSGLSRIDTARCLFELLKAAPLSVLGTLDLDAATDLLFARAAL